MHDFARDAQHAWRRLRRAPAFTLTTFTVLALGLGATTAMFSIVNGVLLRSLPYRDAGRLVDLSHSIQVPGIDHISQSDATFLLYERHNTVFESVGASRDVDVNLGPLAGTSTEAERVTATSVSSGLFATLGVVPLRGRGFLAGEDRVTGQKVVVISEGLWRRKYGADANVVGKQVIVNGVPRDVVGIMPESFQYPSRSTELWMPIAFDPAHAEVGSFNYTGVARLKPGVTLQAAKADLARFLPNLLDEYPSEIPKAMFEQAHLAPMLKPLRDVVVGGATRLLWILFGAVTVIWLIACANVANLFLVRAEGRQRELAIRNALGGGRGALVAQYLSEATLLSVAGGGAGLALAQLAMYLLASLPAGIDVPRIHEVSLDAGVVLFAVAATVLTTIAVCAVPLLRTRRIPIAAVLKESGRSATTGAEKHRVRGALVVAQIALALVLVAASGLMARSFARLRNVKPGFNPEGVLTMRLALPANKYRNAPAAARFYNDLLTGIRALPGVSDVGLTTLLPLSGSNDNSALEIEDFPQPANAVPPVHDFVNASDRYFASMAIPILSGRTFGAIDALHPVREVVVSQALARKYWKGASPLGRRVRPGLTGDWFTIVGVVGDVHMTGLDSPSNVAIYFPMVVPTGDSAEVDLAAALTIRTAGDAAALTASVRRVVRQLDPTLPTYAERAMTELTRASAARTRFLMLLLGTASGIALILGSVGIYGVMAYGVSLRHREIGVRMALGARPSDVSRMISGQGLMLAGLGVVIGLGATMSVTHLMRGLLYDVSPTDPVTLVGTCAALLAVALLASWLPARRAAGVDPAVALRSE